MCSILVPGEFLSCDFKEQTGAGKITYDITVLLPPFLDLRLHYLLRRTEKRVNTLPYAENMSCHVTEIYLAEHAVQRFVLGHELIQENFKGVDPHSDGGFPPVPLLLSHGLLQNVLKQGVQVFVADALTVVHLWGNITGVSPEEVLLNWVLARLTASAVE